MQVRTQSWFRLLSAAMILGLSAQVGWSAMINPNFDDQVLTEGSSSGAAPTGWSAQPSSGGLGAQNYAGPMPPTTGENWAFVNGSEAGGPGGIFQTTSDLIAANMKYELKVDVGNISNFPSATYDVSLYGFNGVSRIVLSNSNGTATLTGQSTVGSLSTLAVTYTSLANADPFLGQSIGISLATTTGIQVVFDTVRLAVTPVPEPTACSLLAVGLVGLFIARRQRGK